MCTRFFPDIIVAAEINNSVSHATGEADPQVCVSIDDCLLHQADYKQFGISNVFIGFGDKEWGKEDYLEYFNALPQYFHPTGSRYQVNLGALWQGVGRNDTTGKQYGKLFTQGTYPPKVLRALGLATQK